MKKDSLYMCFLYKREFSLLDYSSRKQHRTQAHAHTDSQGTAGSRPLLVPAAAKSPAVNRDIARFESGAGLPPGPSALSLWTAWAATGMWEGGYSEGRVDSHTEQAWARAEAPGRPTTSQARTERLRKAERLRRR